LKKNKPLTMAAMPNAGKSLTAYVRDSPMDANTLRAMLVHLLRGMVLYQRAGFVHNDLHGGNIMVGADGIARYIDFGQGFRPAALRTWEDLNLGRRFAAEYVWLAPELHAIRAGRDRVAVARLYGKVPEYKQLEALSPDRTHFTEVLPVVARRIGDTEPVTWMRTNAFKIDWWRLGITFWQIWRRLRQRSPDAAVDRVVAGLTEFDPVRRMSPAAALRLLGATGGARRLTHRASRTRRQSVKARRS
jgi:serine/threonine protein kinase